MSPEQIRTNLKLAETALNTIVAERQEYIRLNQMALTAAANELIRIRALISAVSEHCLADPADDWKRGLKYDDR